MRQITGAKRTKSNYDMSNFPNSSIRIKYGKCIDCSDNEPQKPLTAKRCQFHYKQHRAKENEKKPRNRQRQAVKAVNGAYLASQTLIPVNQCENCGAYLGRKTITNIAHILGKAIFKSVATHPQNKFFACWQCHADYDNRGEQYVVTMPILPLLQERVKKLLPELAHEELRRLPSYFQNL